MDLCDQFYFVHRSKSITNPCFQFLISIFLCHTIQGSCVFLLPRKKFPLLKSQFIFFSSLTKCEKRTEFGIGLKEWWENIFCWVLFFSNQNMIKHKFVIQTILSCFCCVKQKIWGRVKKSVGCGLTPSSGLHRFQRLEIYEKLKMFLWKVFFILHNLFFIFSNQ